MACNRKELVDVLLSRFKDVDNYDEPLQLQLMKETHTSSGKLFCDNIPCTILVFFPIIYITIYSIII